MIGEKVGGVRKIEVEGRGGEGGGLTLKEGGGKVWEEKAGGGENSNSMQIEVNFICFVCTKFLQTPNF